MTGRLDLRCGHLKLRFPSTTSQVNYILNKCLGGRLTVGLGGGMRSTGCLLVYSESAYVHVHKCLSAKSVKTDNEN